MKRGWVQCWTGVLALRGALRAGMASPVLTNAPCTHQSSQPPRVAVENLPVALRVAVVVVVVVVCGVGMRALVLS